MIVRFAWPLVLILGMSFSAMCASAEQIQPEEVITAAPLAGFSERAGLWPATQLPAPNSENESLEHTLNSTSGVQARTMGSPTVSIRGSGSSDRVLQLFEGVPLNLGDGIGASPLYIPEEAIGALTIFKGPASAFYGNSAMAGAVDYHLHFYEKPAVRLSLGANTSSLDDGAVFAAVPFGGSQLTGYYRNQTSQFPYRSVSGFGSGLRSNNQTETSRATYAGNFRWEGLEVRPRFILAKSVGETPGPLNSPFASTFDYSGSLASLDVEKQFSAATSASLRLSDVRQWGLYDRGTQIQSNSFTSRSSASGDLRSEFGSTVVARSFADARWDQLSASYFGDAHPTQFNFEAGEAFEISLPASWSVQPVLRYRAESGDLFKSIALLHTAAESREWLTYAEGFRAPSLSDRFSELSYFKGNPGLQPERSRAVELGAENQVSENLNAGAAVFLIRYDQLFDTSPAGPFATTKINAGRALAKGGEFFAAFRISQNDIRAGYSYLDAKNEDSLEPLRLSPLHQISIGVKHTWSFVSAEIKDTIWSGYLDREAPSNNVKALPGWSMIDINIQSSFQDWELRAGVLNLLDTPRELTYAYPEAQLRAYVSALRFL